MLNNVHCSIRFYKSNSIILKDLISQHLSDYMVGWQSTEDSNGLSLPSIWISRKWNAKLTEILKNICSLGRNTMGNFNSKCSLKMYMCWRYQCEHIFRNKFWYQRVIATLTTQGVQGQVTNQLFHLSSTLASDEDRKPATRSWRILQ